MSRYDNFSKDELVELLEKQDKELKRKKYGLSWDAEKEPEQVVVDCQNNLPVLKNINNKNIVSDDIDDFNIMIEGDNYHALQVLNYTHKGKIDVIYIDPPYNTGNKDFKYNDKFVEKDDGYRHSKWLNFMEKRLDLAKELLKESGVIFISIDDNEQANLKLLCDKIFGENNFVNNFMWLHGKGKKDKNSRTLQQYTLCYSKNKNYLNEWINKKQVQGTMSNPDNDSRGEWFSGSISFDEKRSSPNHRNFYSIKSPSGEVWTRQWQVSEEEMEDLLENNKIYFGLSPDFKNTPRIKMFKDEYIETIPDNIIESKGTTKSAIKELSDILGGEYFDNPKPTTLLGHLINISTKKTGVILDFFVGSGTTAHAVLALNKEDGGKRKFIVCTNNENNIAEEVCYPRIQKVIKGYTKAKNGEKIDGLGGNLKYFKTDFVKNTGNQLKLKLSITKKCTEMLCLKNNIFNLEQKSDNYKIFSNNNKDSYVAIYYCFYDDDIDEFINNIKLINKKTIVYIFSLDNYADKEHFRDYKNIKVEPIPQQILDVYSKIQKEHIK